MILMTLDTTQYMGKAFHSTDLLLAHIIRSKIAQMCIIMETFKQLYITQLSWVPIFFYNINCEEVSLRKGQGIINSHAPTLSAQELRSPIKPSLWQSWLLQNTISYCFSILGQCTRATWAMCIDHTLRDMGEISSACVYSQTHFCSVFLRYFSGR